MRFERLAKGYRRFAVIFLNVVLLFGLINLVAYWTISAPVKKKQYSSKRPHKAFYKEPKDFIKQLDRPDNLLYKVYPGHDKARIKKIFSQGKLVDHPSLGHAMSPGAYGEYHIGKEGVRYDNKTRPDNIDSLLVKGAVWVLGGSTTYGHCMAQNETLPALLNAIDSSQTYLNFGISGFNQTMEIEKLIILLKKGYQPQKVIFVDGNNDLLGNLFMNLHPAEMAGRNIYSYPFRTNVNVLNQDEKVNWQNLFPVIKLMRGKSNKTEKEEIWSKLNLPYENLDDSTSLYYHDAKIHKQATSWLPCANMPFYPQKIFDLYAMNEKLVGKLAEAYDFEYEFIFQPLGFLHTQNPFIEDFEAYKNAFNCYDLLVETQQVIRDSIASGALHHFRDLSQSDTGCAYCYVDLVHYSAPFNELLVELMLAPKY